MKKAIHIEGKELYLSKRYLKDFATLKTMEFWNDEMGVIKIFIDNEIYFLYKSIPYRTRKKLPQEETIISQGIKSSAYSKVKSLLHDAFYYKYASYKSIYEKETSFTTVQITKFSQLHSVFQTIIDLKQKESFHHLMILHEAFNCLFPGKYKTKQAFSQAILKASVDGVMSVAMDKRTFGNNDRTKKETTPQVDFIISVLVASNGKLSNPSMLEKANEYFREKGLKEFGLSWMKKQRREWLKNPEVYRSRYGTTEAQKIMPYASLKNATHTHIQWQVDGVTLPFWEEVDINGKREKYHRSVLVFVIDNCSKKIIGYAVGYTENSLTIKEAIRNAVYNTGVLPFELVMDNHSFTQTNAAFNFETLLKKVGSTLTKTSNPRQKVIVERYIQNLNSLFKSYHGYLGKSIRSKSIEATASDELKTKYAKDFKTHSEVIAITTEVIENYNNKVQNIKSPNQSFIDNGHPQPIRLNMFHQAEFLPFQTEKQIRCGQITFKRGIEKFEYQLPANLYQKWNNETVLVIHDDLRDGIYLYNKADGEGIVFLTEKQKINNSKALQTNEDLEAFYKHKGRLKGIETKARKQLEDVRDKALNLDPEAYISVSALTTPKNIRKELEQNAHLKMLVEDNGVNVNELPISDETFDIPIALKPVKKDTNPFTVKGHTIEIYKPEIENEEDID